MKRIVALGLILLIVGIFALQAKESDMFVKTQPIVKIYTHRLGFKVIYLKSDLSMAEFYVPIDWFSLAGGKGVLVKGEDSAYPYFSIFWLNGEFNSIKLYVKSNLQDLTWGALETTPGLRDRFNVETLDLEF